MSPFVRAAFVSLLPVALAGIGEPAEARITRIQIDSRAVAFGGASFGAVGQYETLRGVAFGEVDPNDPRPSLQERYPTRADYVAKVTAAAASLVARRLLLPEDAAFLIDQANAAAVP